MYSSISILFIALSLFVHPALNYIRRYSLLHWLFFFFIVSTVSSLQGTASTMIVTAFTLMGWFIKCIEKYSFFLARHCINNDSFSFYIDGSDQHLYWKYNFFLVRHCINNDSYSFYIDGSVQQMYPKVQFLPCRALHQLMQPPLVLVIWSTHASVKLVYYQFTM